MSTLQHSSPSIERRALSGGEVRVCVEGPWTLQSVAPGSRRLELEASRLAGENGAIWDLSGLTALDSAGALLLWRAWGRRLPHGALVPPEHRRRFEQLRQSEPPRPSRHRWTLPDLVIAIGRWALDCVHHGAALTALLGQLLLDTMTLVRHPRQVPLRETSAAIYRTGAQAIPITGLVGFLVGLILAYLSAGQLRSFGAEELVVNLVGIGIFRELGPLLGCMLLAGRSGAAITAELGAMRLTQEIDAMVVLGLPPSIRLIWPKVVALSVIAPLIAIWTSCLGMLGGATVAFGLLHMTPLEFFTRLADVLPPADVWIGFGKSAAFGGAIGLIACHRGLEVRPTTTSLGEETTASVVIALTAVIALDAIFAIGLQGVGSG